MAAQNGSFLSSSLPPMELVVDGVRFVIESSIFNEEGEHERGTISISTGSPAGGQSIDFSNFSGRLRVLSEVNPTRNDVTTSLVEHQADLLVKDEHPDEQHPNHDEDRHLDKSRPFRHSSLQYTDADSDDDRSLESFDDHDTLDLHAPVSPLHAMCASPEATLASLLQARDSDPASVREPDKEGQFPIHILSQNTSLLRTPQGREDASEFCLMLVDEYLDAITFKNAAGHFPFQRAIEEWVDGTYRNAALKAPSVRSGRVSMLMTAISGLNLSRHGDTTSGNTDDVSMAGTEHGDTEEQALSSTRRSFWGHSDSFLSQRNSSHLVEDPQDTSIGGKHAYKLCPYAVVPPHVDWAFTTISRILAGVNKAYANKKLKMDELVFVWVSLTKALASIPYLTKTILLIEQDDVRQRLLQESIIQRVLLSPTACGRWICPMLHRRGVASHRAIDYFVEVSQVTVASYVGQKRTPRSHDVEAFEKDKQATYAVLGSIARVIPSLAVLDQKETERAAATDVVWDIVSRSMSRPCVVGILVLDLLFHVGLVLVYRLDVSQASFDLLRHQLDEEWQQRVSDTFIVSVCIYFLFRKASEVFALLRISKRAFRTYSLDMWNFIDAASIVLPLATCLLDGDYPGWFAFTTAVLWLRLLGILKAINMELATFILAIFEIMKDIKWFLVVLGIFILMFADMIHIITTRSGSDYCSSDEAPSEFCSERVSLAYLKLYAVIVGDVALDDFSYNPVVALLFCIFMLYGFIVLLNVLIAIVSDSYEKSVMRAKFLFGRARVGFAVTHVAQEQFLQGSPIPPLQGAHSLCNHNFSLWIAEWIGRWTMLTCLVWTFVVAEAYMIIAGMGATDSGSQGSKVMTMILIVLLSMLLFVAMTLVLQNLFREALDRIAGCLHMTGLNNSITSILHYILQLITENLLGIHHATGLAESRGWHGKFEFLENTMHRLLDSTEQQLTNTLQASEQRIKAHDSQVAETVKTHTEQVLRGGSAAAL